MKINNFWMEVCDKFVFGNPTSERQIDIVVDGSYRSFVDGLFPNNFNQLESAKGYQTYVTYGHYKIVLENGISLMITVGTGGRDILSIQNPQHYEDFYKKFKLIK